MPTNPYEVVDVDDQPTRELNPSQIEEHQLLVARSAFFMAKQIPQVANASVVYPTHVSFPSVEHQDKSLMTRASRLHRWFIGSSPT